jgi:hypothetical protein
LEWQIEEKTTEYRTIGVRKVGRMDQGGNKLVDDKWDVGW